MSATSEVTDRTFGAEIEATTELCVVDFWAPWCGPCRMIAPALEQLATTYAGRTKIAKLNVDENPATTTRFGVRSIPSLLFFRGGSLIDTIVGVVPRAELDARIVRHLNGTRN